MSPAHVPPSATTPPGPGPVATLTDPVVARIAELSSVLTRALASLASVPPGPRALGRHLQLDKSLAWKIYRIAHATDPADALPLLPGSRGRRLVLQAFSRAGSPSGHVEAIRSAMDGVDAELARSGMDRHTLAAALAESRRNGLDRSLLRKARLMAFRAHCVTMGMHGSAAVASFMVVPSAQRGGWVDLGYASLFEGFTRTREGSPWPLYVPMQRFDTTAEDPADTRVDGAAMLPNDGHAGPLQGILVDEVVAREDRSCLRMVESGDRHLVELDGRGPAIGRRMRLAFAERSVAHGPMHASAGDRIAALQATIRYPVAHFICQVLLHHDVLRDGDPLPVCFSAAGRIPGADPRCGVTRLPLLDAMECPEPTSLPEVLAPTRPALAQMLGHQARQMGVPLDACACFRISVTCPPVQSTLGMRWRLARA